MKGIHEKMEITDMNLICLEECFEYLELRDLLSVAVASKRLCKAAEFVFYQKYSQRCVCFEFTKFSNPKYSFLVDKSEISLNGDLKTSLQILRCFGHMIKDLIFHFNSTDDQIQAKQHVLDYINKYCADFLVKIRISPGTFPFKVQDVIFTKPFTQVEEVEISDCRLAVKGEKLGILFPKIKSFYCSGENKYDLSFLVYHYPYLEDLSIDMTKHTTSILQLNPQLKKLKLRGNKDYVCDENTFRNSIEPMQNLEALTLSDRVAKFSKFNKKKIILKNIKKFGIDYSKGISKYPFLFEQLESFNINIELYRNVKITPYVYDFIEQHPTIKELSINSDARDKSNVDLSRIQKALPLLTKITHRRLC